MPILSFIGYIMTKSFGKMTIGNKCLCSTFYTSSKVSQKTALRKKILDMTFLYKSVEVLTSARAYAIVIYFVFKKACSSNHGIFR